MGAEVKYRAEVQAEAGSRTKIGKRPWLRLEVKAG